MDLILAARMETSQMGQERLVVVQRNRLREMNLYSRKSKSKMHRQKQRHLKMKDIKYWQLRS